MNITHIFHSGFAVETDEAVYLIDYFKGALPKFGAGRLIVVLASHAHEDHYNPAVFKLIEERGESCSLAVLAKDIGEKRYPEGIDVLRVCADASYELPGGDRLETFRSTDSGVAFLLTTREGETLFHAGDLNDWTWDGEDENENRQMRGSFRHEIDKLAGRHIDAACMLLDPRQEAHYADGMLYLLKKTDARSVYPMHYGRHADIIDRFFSEHPEHAERIVKP